MVTLSNRLSRWSASSGMDGEGWAGDRDRGVDMREGEDGRNGGEDKKRWEVLRKGSR